MQKRRFSSRRQPVHITPRLKRGWAIPVATLRAENAVRSHATCEGYSASLLCSGGAARRAARPGMVTAPPRGAREEAVVPAVEPAQPDP